MQDQIIPPTPKLPSEKRIAAARANGAKSRGPKTPEGRLKCAQAASNQFKHSMLADAILRKGESRKSFTAMLEHYYQVFQPRTGPERDIIKKMAVSYWRQMRIWSTAQTKFNQEIGRQNPTFPAPSKPARPPMPLTAKARSSRKPSATKPPTTAASAAPCATSNSSANSGPTHKMLFCDRVPRPKRKMTLNAHPKPMTIKHNQAEPSLAKTPGPPSPGCQK